NPSLEGIDAFAPSSKQLGELLGELHLALASDEQDPEFAPEPITEEDVSEWRSSINERLEQLEPCFDEGDSMLQHLWKEIAAAFKSLEPVLDPGMKMRIHGDYHLGQILRAGQEWFILDFEGEPSRPLEERRRKMSPLRDVAIMMRSFNYVALSVAVERARPDSEEWRPQRLHANHWESAMRAAFLEGYYSLTDSSRLLPEKRADRQRLLNIFELNRAITELSYDINSRPDWAHICVHTISRILGLGEIESAAQS
ncbi:MAG TPA: phosphotransferase, partial [Blastocatellia bacterium]|nr:phosphotransferase [Blastocatellia bacterium]